MAFERPLSKSKLVAFRQCAKRLWLEVHRPELRQDSGTSLAAFRTGHQVGEIAQRLYDPHGLGEIIDFKTEGLPGALERTRSLLQSGRPLFEAGFAAEGALAFADVMLPHQSNGLNGWRMVEVKSSTSVKAYQQDDVAIQSFVARASGVTLHCVSVAHIDSAWVYPGGGDYRGLLTEVDVSEQAFARTPEVRAWIAEAQVAAASAQPPEIGMGRHCTQPFDCGFATHCAAGRPPPEFPLAWLPGAQSKGLRDYIDQHRADDMRDVPESLLNAMQRRVRDATLAGIAYFDAAGAAAKLRDYSLPAYFMDFETIQFGVPRWAGTRPFQMLPFQFSVHRLSHDGQLTSEGFLDLSGDDPSEAFAMALIEVCHQPLPVFVYNASFEGGRLDELAQRFVHLRDPLLDIRRRMVDLYPIARQHYYHPACEGSWSIKKLLPNIAPHLDYAALSGVQDGGLAMQAYLEAIDPLTPSERKEKIKQQLTAYCVLDTLAMVEIWKYFTEKSF